MTNVLFHGAHLYRNLGGPSLLISTCKALRTHLPDARFKFFSPFPKEDAERAAPYGVEVVGFDPKEFYRAFVVSLFWKSFRKIGIDLSFLLKKGVLREYRNADLVVDIKGITFTDFFPSPLAYLIHTLQLLLGVVLGKRVVKFTQEMGPFENKWNRFFAKLCLNRMDFILARSDRTKQYVEQLGVKRPVYVHPDTAFILDVAPDEELSAIMEAEDLLEKPLIAVVPSRQIDKRISEKERRGKESQNSYTRAVARAADYLIEKWNATVLFLPNEISRVEEGYDDIYVARKILEAVQKKEKVKLISKEYPAPLLKGLISRCDMAVVSRYHSMVAALSTATPCLVVGWGFKYSQVMDRFGQSRFICDFQTVTFDEMKGKLDELWHDRERVKSDLESRLPTLEQTVLSGGKLVKDLLGESHDR